ncbi:alanine--tRNA ligase [Luteimonas sp. MC1750]|uniref:alanine--tRNA ligase n=1 Tax=Luteimonas sp. MC1750 TaxID=2799326 RepID=UPI0018F07819|nr:alanine--tRNA ligase [Luteimonas sp. MC1750]MBJ6984055.1 alanine--tRNA ligase [Luteimonas sp. MC1750]QQO06866.1 alanine--tRNA ligase [Luteimonas sp. MC1750]
MPSEPTPARPTTADIRRDFLDFFSGRGHTIVPSAPLVPGNDPTLLFTNSGMVQFKDVFLGAEKRSYVRAADVQRCLRAGGKHNDLDQVGYTARHHTFFEMLGNWSFGDYFKRDAIAWAWELLTEVWNIPAERLVVTVYHTDDEAHGIWRDVIGVPEDRIIRIGDNKGAPFASDNFWQMADTGPCGPCTEIFYDHGAHIAGGPPGSPDEDGDRYIEIWNLVFMQFDRQPDGRLDPLPAPCVDTGMGLERLAAVLQGVHGNYEIDLFQALIAEAARLTGTADLGNKSLRVIADHIRACSFLVADGVLPSNEGRGYVLRRIIRRALRHGWMLGVRQPFFHKLVGTLDAQMGEAYPVLREQRALVERALLAEEERFAETLDSGMRIFDEVAARSAGPASNGVIPGADAFRLYDTYGFPLDLTADMARERGMGVDTAGFDAAMAQQRETARAAGKFGGGTTLPAELVARIAPTGFLGYDQVEAAGLEVVAILRAGVPVERIDAGDEAIVLLDRTPFYAESGGQVGDTGSLASGNADGPGVPDAAGAGRPGTVFRVDDTRKFAGQFHGHVGELQAGTLAVGDRLGGRVDAARRGTIVLNHSATHLLHGALRERLGTHVAQKGSLVAPDRLRFDFSHFEPISAAELRDIELSVNDEVRADHGVEIREMGMQDAIDAGAIALFGEKYGERVRVVRMGGSVELCGGTHVGRTGEIGLFKLVSEGGVSAGVRRVEAVTGRAALEHVAREEARLEEAARLLGGTTAEVADKLRALLDRQKKLERELDTLKARAASSATADLSAGAVEVGGIKVLAARIEGLDARALRDALDRCKQQLGDAVVLLAGASDGRAALVAGVSGAALGRIKAGELLSAVATQVGGKGGGRPDMAQGGGEDGPALQAALAAVPDWVAAHLS